MKDSQCHAPGKSCSRNRVQAEGWKASDKWKQSTQCRSNDKGPLPGGTKVRGTMKVKLIFVPHDPCSCVLNWLWFMAKIIAGLQDLIALFALNWNKTLWRHLIAIETWALLKVQTAESCYRAFRFLVLLLLAPAPPSWLVNCFPIKWLSKIDTIDASNEHWLILIVTDE